MSISASTCLTYTGNTPLGSTLYFFSDLDSYTTSFGSVSTNLIIGGNCPYIITGIPNGTTTIKLRDYTSGCCVDVPILSNDLCTVCNLDFSLFSSTTVSQIVAGDLLTSCEDEVVDYVIFWYGPDSSTNVAYTSGAGTQFDYEFPHPLIGATAIFAQSGTYTPVIDKIISNGVTFSQTGGTGYYNANLDCFSSVTVNSLRCDNGNQPMSAYTHFYNFSGASQGLPSPPLQVTFQISANTNYFAWKFRGFSVPDTLTISYSGPNYSVPLVMDRIVVGDNLTTNDTSWLNYTKSADTINNVSRVICLTGLTRSGGNEYMIIDLVPNSGFTNWELSLTCLDFDCSKCTDNHLNDPYKIVLSGVTANTFNNDNQIVSSFSASCYTKVRFSVSGCTSSSILDSDIYKYYQQAGIGLQNTYKSTSWSNGISGLFGSADKLFFNQSDCNTFGLGSLSNTNLACASSDLSSIITYSKYVSGSCPNCVGVIYFEFNQIDDLNFYYQDYLNAMSDSTNWGYSACTSGTTSGTTFNGGSFTGPFSGGTSANNILSYLDSSDYRYYRYLWLAIPTATGTTICGQNTEGGGGGFTGNFNNGKTWGIRIHPSSIVSTGITGSNYYLEIIMNKVEKGITISDCAIDCESLINNFVNDVNNNSTGSTLNFSATTQTGSYFTNPFLTYGIFLDCNSYTGYSENGWFVMNEWSNKTLPFSSSTAPLYAYSAVTCPAYGEGLNTVYQYLFDYQVRLLNDTSTDFQIWAKTITNGVRSANYSDLAITYSGGSFVYTNPTYVIT